MHLFTYRQEAFQLASMRRKKADDYRMQQIAQSIKTKDDKYDAIQKGYRTLSTMREKMKDIVSRASYELKVHTYTRIHAHLHDITSLHSNIRTYTYIPKLIDFVDIIG